jgi:hypothetical protein
MKERNPWANVPAGSFLASLLWRVVHLLDEAARFRPGPASRRTGRAHGMLKSGESAGEPGAAVRVGARHRLLVYCAAECGQNAGGYRALVQCEPPDDLSTTAEQLEPFRRKRDRPVKPKGR